MGRPPSEKPLTVLVSFRLDAEAAAKLEIEREARETPGLTLSRHDLARMLTCERLDELRGRKTKKSK